MVLIWTLPSSYLLDIVSLRYALPPPASRSPFLHRLTLRLRFRFRFLLPFAIAPAPGGFRSSFRFFHTFPSVLSLLRSSFFLFFPLNFPFLSFPIIPGPFNSLRPAHLIVRLSASFSNYVRLGRPLILFLYLMIFSLFVTFVFICMSCFCARLLKLN
jgi:hypothetical protein